MTHQNHRADGRDDSHGSRTRPTAGPPPVGVWTASAARWERWRSLLVAGLALLVPAGATAGPPFLTDDPQPVDYQHWELYVASMDFRTAGGWSGDGPHVEVNYGAVPNVQLHVIAPVAYDAPKDGPSHYGYGDTELGVKFRFVQETKNLPMIGIFPLLEVPSGSAREGLGTGRTHALLPVWLQKTWGSWTVYGGGGYGINPGPGLRNYGFVGTVLQKQVTKPLLVGVEVYHQTTPVVGGRGDTAFNVGTVFDFSEEHHLLFSAGRSLSGPTDFQCYLAYQFTFDNTLFRPGKHPGK